MATDKRTLLQNIKTELLNQTWTGSSNKVFGASGGSVVITTYTELDAVMAYCQSPFAIIIPGDFPSDPEAGEEPDFLIGEVTVRIGCIIQGETLGENPLMGANRADTTKSEGAGLYQIEQEVYNALGRLNTNDGIDIQFRQTSEVQATVDASKRYIAFEDMKFEAVCTTVDSSTEQSLISTVVQAADQTDATATLTNITNLTFAVTAGTTYYFRFLLIFRSSLTTVGLQTSVTFPSATVFAATARIPVSVAGANSEFQGSITTSGEAVIGTGVIASVTAFVAVIDGMITPSASGNLQCQFGSETVAGTVTLVAGSSGLLQTIP